DRHRADAPAARDRDLAGDAALRQHAGAVAGELEVGDAAVGLHRLLVIERVAQGHALDRLGDERRADRDPALGRQVADHDLEGRGLGGHGLTREAGSIWGGESLSSQFWPGKPRVYSIMAPRRRTARRPAARPRRTARPGPARHAWRSGPACTG